MFKSSKIICIVLFVFVYANTLNAFTNTRIFNNVKVSAQTGQIKKYNNTLDNYKEDGFNELLDSNQKALKQGKDSIPIYKNLAIINAELNDPKQAYEYTNKYIMNSLDFSILSNDSFENIKNSDEYKLLSDRYLVKINFLSFLYFYIALIGLFLVVILSFKKRGDKLSNILISSFVFLQVLFVIEYVLCMTNIQYRYPHSYLFSSALTLMNGPLLFFYFKRVIQGYVLKKIDLIHFVPTIILLIFVLSPIYLLNEEEKVKMMLGISDINKYNGTYIFMAKFFSLFIYGIFIGKLFFTKIRKISTNNTAKKNIYWKNIYRIYIVYVLSYLIYGLSISGALSSETFKIIYYLHVGSISVMIVYISYMVYAQPKLFYNEPFILNTNTLKYEKSGLTESLSKELSENLFMLFNEEKVYKDSGITLESLSQKLGTTRHNTSQIINEHFNMNFFELINKFRIEEAIEILKSDLYGSLHIIDIAYEVGFNNKVTFNKAFKKETSQTPSEFIASTQKKNKQ